MCAGDASIVERELGADAGLEKITNVRGTMGGLT